MNEKPMSIWISLGKKELSHRQKKLAIIDVCILKHI
jgi:hypothetical protein